MATSEGDDDIGGTAPVEFADQSHESVDSKENAGNFALAVASVPSTQDGTVSEDPETTETPETKVSSAPLYYCSSQLVTHLVAQLVSY